MTAAETRAMWSRTTPETWDAMTRAIVRFFAGKDPETQSPPTEPEPAPELPFSTAPEITRV